MPRTSEQIVAEIMAHVSAPYDEWYAGIARRARTRLFDAHRVDEAQGSWIFLTAASNADARAAAVALHGVGFRGGPGDGEPELTTKPKTRKVYAYRITGSTVE